MTGMPTEAHRALAFDDWPEVDRRAWARAVSPGTALLDAGPGARWRVPTRRRYRWAYGHWLTFLRCRDLLDPAAAPAARLTRTRIDAFVTSLRDRELASGSVASYVQALYCAMRAMAPEDDWSWLRTIVNLLERLARPVPKDPSALPDIDEVYAAALAWLDAAETMIAKRPLQDCVWFRDGLIVAVGAATALRRKNLATLDLDRHLERVGDQYRIAIGAEEIKTRRAYEAPLPRSLTPYLDRYLAHHRPRLLQGRDQGALFVRYTGDPVTATTLSHRFRAMTRRLGVEMSCHDLRRASATTIAEKHPEDAWLIRDLLHHNGSRTGDRHYNRARMVLSAGRYGDTITRLKSRLRSADPAPAD